MPNNCTCTSGTLNTHTSLERRGAVDVSEMESSQDVHVCLKEKDGEHCGHKTRRHSSKMTTHMLEHAVSQKGSSNPALFYSSVEDRGVSCGAWRR